MSNTVIEWRLRSLARSKGMGPTELSVRLRSLGVGRSVPQMSRLLNYPPEMVSLALGGRAVRRPRLRPPGAAAAGLGERSRGWSRPVTKGRAGRAVDRAVADLQIIVERLGPPVPRTNCDGRSCS